MFNNVDLQVTKQALKAKANATGVLPTAVTLCLPGRENVAWDMIAAEHLLAVAKAKHFGLKPPSVLTPTDRLEEEYDYLNRMPVSLQDLQRSVHEADDAE